MSIFTTKFIKNSSFNSIWYIYYTTISDFVIQTAIDVFDFATESEERLSVTLSTERVNGGCGVIENGGHHVLIGIIIAI